MASLPAPQSTCVASCPDPPSCAICQPNEECIRITRSCDKCAETRCRPLPSNNPSSGGGVSKGALAGGVVGAILFLALAIFLFLRYRKRSLVRKALAQRDLKKDTPAPAETVLQRPDPTEKSLSELGTVRLYSSTSNSNIDLDPNSQTTPSHLPAGFLPPIANPFDDTNSIQTAGTEGTNVIPIALVPPEYNRGSLSRSENHTIPSSTATYPVRPLRSPELNLNLEHVNVSQDNLRAPGRAQSIRSGISGISSRNSYMSSASYSSEFLNEAPMIMTPTKAVRQVVGVVKAEVISTSGGSLPPTPGPTDSLKTATYSKLPTKSPLAQSSFGPNDTVKEGDESQELIDPFGDENVSTHASYAASPSTTAFGMANRESSQESFLAENPNIPWTKKFDQSRPSSLSTQAGSIIDITSVTRVNVGLKTPGSANSHRTTMGRLVTPPVAGTLQEQQQRALAHAHAQAQAQGLDRRASGASAMSTTTRADSILEAFPFVPPSPISDRPIRSPPVSPLAQQTFSHSTSSSPLHQHTFVVAPPSPLSSKSFSAEPHKTTFGMAPDNGEDVLPAPPSRRTLGLSTGSQLSTASSGLGSFPFQIESEPTAELQPPASFNGRQRASLDTLALTSDLSSYPLDFDKSRPTKK